MRHKRKNNIFFFVNTRWGMLLNLRRKLDSSIKILPEILSNVTSGSEVQRGNLGEGAKHQSKIRSDIRRARIISLSYLH